MIIVTIAGLLMLSFDLIFGESLAIVTALIGLAAFAASAFLLYYPAEADLSLVSGFIREVMAHDAYARFYGFCFCTMGALVLLISISYKPRPKYIGEFFSLIVISTSAFMFLAAATNLLMIYLCIEFIGVIAYVLAAYHKEDARSGEAAIKYLLIGGAASAIMAYGMSLLYGFTGSLDIKTIGAALANGSAPSPAAAWLALCMVLAGLGYKIAIVPFHQWAPDIYEGAPTPVTAFFSVAPKAAGVAVLMRVFLAAFPTSIVNWVPLLSVLAVVTMTFGNVVAIWQTNIKRMFAYSSIAQVGYMLIGLVVAGSAGLDTQAGKNGLFAAMFYVVAYIVTNIGVFAAIIIFSNALGTDDLKYYKGLGRRAPFACSCFTLLMLSLGGVPPTAGFVGKFFLFMYSINTGYVVLAIFLAANSVTSMFFYWSIVRRMFVDPGIEDHSPIRGAFPLNLALAIATCGVLTFAIFFQPLMRYVTTSLL